MNTVIHLVIRLIIGPGHGLMHTSSGMTLELSYFGIKRPLSNFYCRKQTGISMCLTMGVALLASTTDIQLVFSSQYTVGAPGWIAKASMYPRITFDLLTALYMNLISPSLESYAIAG